MKDILELLDFPDELAEAIPKRWEMFGNVLVLKIDDELMGHKTKIAKAYAEVLDAKSVLLDTGGINGKY